MKMREEEQHISKKFLAKQEQIIQELNELNFSLAQEEQQQLQEQSIVLLKEESSETRSLLIAATQKLEQTLSQL